MINLDYFDNNEVKDVIREYMFVNNIEGSNDTKTDLANVSKHYDGLVDKFAEKDFIEKYGSRVDNYRFNFENGTVEEEATQNADLYLSEKGFEGFNRNFGFLPLALAGAKMLATKKGRQDLKGGAQSIAKGVKGLGSFLKKKGKDAKDLFEKNTRGSRPLKVDSNKDAILEMGRVARQEIAMQEASKKQSENLRLKQRALDLQKRAMSIEGFSFDGPLTRQANALVNSNLTSKEILDKFEDVLDNYKKQETAVAVNEVTPKLIIGGIALLVIGYLLAKNL